MNADSRIDQIPEEFDTIEAAAEIWDTHSLADYWDETTPIELDVNLTRRAYWVALEHELAEKVTERAHEEGVNPATLVNLWVSERLSLPRGG